MGKFTCYICHKPNQDTRPYGHGGQSICFPCMIADPEREKEATKNFRALLEAALAAGNGLAMSGVENGPIPVHFGVDLAREEES